jgi:hypothetical protein
MCVDIKIIAGDGTFERSTIPGLNNFTELRDFKKNTRTYSCPGAIDSGEDR